MGNSPLTPALATMVAMLQAACMGSGPRARSAVSFTDVTLAAGIDFVETIGDDEMSNIVESAGVGCAFLDYDLDGWMDICLINGCWLKGLSDPDLAPRRRDGLAAATDRLYRNRGDGTFEDVTARAGLAKSGYGMGVAVADYDGDGDPDLYITNYGPNFLYRNNGDGTFTDVARTAGVRVPEFSVGAAFFDYDRDGWLDLYVGNYVAYDAKLDDLDDPSGFPGPLAYPGQRDKLFRGAEDGTFTDMTDDAGINVDPLGRAMGVSAFDYDNDGLLDVFVANDAMENSLLRNQGDGTFRNRALEAGVAYGEAGNNTAAMAVEIADYDGDAHFDVFVPDMSYSCLYHNEGEGLFAEVSASSGIAAACGRYASWGAAFADLDLDGNLDLYVSNGGVRRLEAQEDLLLLGDGRGRFSDASRAAGAWAKSRSVSRGVAGGDFDNDGDIDLLVASLNGRPVLLRNDTPRRGRHWVGVELRGRPGNRDAIGARVEIEIGRQTMVRHRSGSGSYLSSHDPRVHFGIGERKAIDRLEVIWADGVRQTIRSIPADRYCVIRRKHRSE